MIASITGMVQARSATSCVLQVAGLGLRVWMSTRALAALPSEGDQVTVYTHLHVREDEISLFGFGSPVERELFEKLITVSGIGPRVALAVLSTFAPDELARAISAEDDVLIATVPGIGKKTAQRIIIELKDKIVAGAAQTRTARSTGAAGEAAIALTSMGFSPAEASVAMSGYSGPEDTQSILRYALKRLGGGA